VSLLVMFIIKKVISVFFYRNRIIRGTKLVASCTPTNICRVMGTVRITHPYEHSNQSYGTKIFVP
jgi:hypothetical protein